MAKVYSTETGRLCPGCEQPVQNCNCKPTQVPPKRGDGIVRLRRETKGRKGAGVTLVDGLNQNDKQLKATAKQLKSLCGCGGAVKDGIIEIQGDQRDRIKEWLSKQGHTVKIAGG